MEVFTKYLSLNLCDIKFSATILFDLIIHFFFFVDIP